MKNSIAEFGLTIFLAVALIGCSSLWRTPEFDRKKAEREGRYAELAADSEKSAAFLRYDIDTSKKMARQY